MKLLVSKIPQSGEKIEFGHQLGWVKTMVEEALPCENPDLNTIQGSVVVSRFEDHVSLMGEFRINLAFACDRCGEVYVFLFCLPLQMNLIPLSPSKKEKDERNLLEDDVELKEEDMEFGFYDGNEIDLREILREQIVLSLPIKRLCSTECRGLCQQCGASLNKSSCSCAKEKPIDSRLEVLGKLKK